MVATSSLIASYLVVRQMASIVRRDASDSESHPRSSSEPTMDVDFYEATGIIPEQLRNFLKRTAERDHLDAYPAHLSFMNNLGNCLMDYPVAITWDGGHDRVTVGQSGVLRIMLRAELLAGLKFRVPQGYTLIKQRTIPLGTTYEPYAEDDATGLGRHVVNDYEVAMRIWRQLARQRAVGEGLKPEQWREQMKRTQCEWRPDDLESAEIGSVASICRKRRDAVVVIGHLLPDGTVIHAAGVILDSDGVIATAYHVIDKPDAVARCVMTADGALYPIQEIIAANRPCDVALIQIKAHGLVAAPLSRGDDEGSSLTILAHPAGEFYSVTQGQLRRYQATVIYGTEVVQMAVTADFTDGASGGPVFNERGEVAGIVSLRRPATTGEVVKIASPAKMIRELYDPTGAHSR